MDKQKHKLGKIFMKEFEYVYQCKDCKKMFWKEQIEGYPIKIKENK
jgi:uncharacterized protein with PIN domain